MAKLINLIPNNQKPKRNEALEDMDVSLPVKMDKFLERTIAIIKGYNLPRKKEQLVIARILDALKLSPSELNQAVQKVKKYGVVTRQKTGNADHDYLGEAVDDISNLVKKIEKYTDRNAHTDAAIELAGFLKNKSMEKILNSIKDIHMEMGSMPVELSKLRTQILNDLLKLVKSKYGNESFTQINSAF